MSWKRTVHGYEGDLQAITYENGPWRIEKEYYAHGASLFSYMVYGPDGFEAEYRTLRQAKASIPDG